MSVTHFLVGSRGHMATTWLTKALNAVPNSFAIHGLTPESEPFKDSPSLTEMLSRMATAKPHHRCGLVHIANASRILMAGLQGEYRNVKLRAAQLFRNPVMLAEAMACVVAREWDDGGKYHVWAAEMREQVLGDRWGKNAVSWPSSVKAALLEDDALQTRRLLGIWSRTKTEAIEAFNFELLAQQIKVNANFGLDSYPAYRFEDYSADFAAFCRLLDHLLDETIERSVAMRAFQSPAVNKHRDGDINDPEQVYLGWSVPERELFATIFSVTGFSRFCEGSLGYRFPYMDSDIQARRGAPDQYQFPGITMNYGMLV